MSCNRHYGIQGYPDCSGNGICVDGYCQCYHNWTGLGDGELVDGYDCDIHIPTIKILAIIYVVVSFPGLIDGVRSLFTLKQFYSTKTACLVACFLTNIGGYVFVVPKIIDPVKYIVGRSMFINVAFAVVLGAAHTIESSYSILMLKFLRGYYRMLRIDIKEKFDRYAFIWNTIMIASPIFLFFVFIASCTACSLSSDSACSKYIVVVAFICFEVLVTLHIICRWSISTIFITEIKSYINKEDAPKSNQTNPHKEVRALLESSLFIFNCIMVFLILEWTTFMFIISWEFIRRKDYYLDIILFNQRSILIPLYINALNATTKSHQRVLKGSVVVFSKKITRVEPLGLPNERGSVESMSKKNQSLNSLRPVNDENEVIEVHKV